MSQTTEWTTPPRRRTRLAAVSCLAALSIGLGACGDGDSGGGGDTGGGGSTAGGFNPALPSPDTQKKGGTLKVLSAEALRDPDPGVTYSQLDYIAIYAVHRSLYYYRPDDASRFVPDIADGQPQVSADARTVTVKLKSGIRYGTVAKTAIDGKEVTAADVKYAFERARNPSVPNAYFATYFASLAGSKDAKGGPIAGITTPNAHTIVFKLDEPVGATFVKALAMPIAIPVPKSYVSQFDAKQPNPYENDPTRQAFTGPYMISGYQANRRITLTRNPRWDPKTDTRPAYLDRIEWTMNGDANVIGRQVFGGSHVVAADTPTAGTVRRFVTRAKDRISFTSIGNRWVPFNTQRKPFSDINLRKAVSAATDRRAMQLTRGAAITGDIASHFLPPGMPGFEEAGGFKGTGVDYLASPTGDAKLAADYVKKAGFASGKFSGPPITMVSSADSPGKEGALVVRRALESLGFEVRQRSVDQSTFYDLCNTLAQERKIDICMNMGWIPDFFDGMAMLNSSFNGDTLAAYNANPALQDDPKINAAMNKAATITDPQARAKAWGDVDRMLVAQAVAMPWYWDKTPNIVSKDVFGVIASWNGLWDLSYMSLK